VTRHLVLASGSPARARLLRDAGIETEVIVSGADETIDSGLDPAVATVDLARRKADAVAVGLAGSDPAPLVLGCDSMLFFAGTTHGKPLTADAATAAWQARRGCSGVLWTGHVLVDLADGRHVDAACATTVHFAEVTDAEIAAYVATGEPLEVAGAFTLDGRGAAFIERIEGDHSNVVGLSLPTLRVLLGELDLTIMDLWR
jgi:septum formation protein